MTTFSTWPNQFVISRLPNFPNDSQDGLAFGVDQFGIIMLDFNETTPNGNGIIGPLVRNNTTGTVRSFWIATNTGSDFYVHIPVPVGTGAVRGVPYQDNAGAIHYITCTQTVPV